MQASTSNNKKRVPLWFFLLMIPVLLGLGALCVLWYWNTHKDAIIRQKIESAIDENTNGLYKISYDSTQVDELEGNLSFYNMHLAYDSARYKEGERMGIVPPILFKVDIPEISVSGVQSARAMTKTEIVGKKLVIKEPVINLYYTYQGKDADLNMPTDDMYREILSGMKLVQVDTILLSNAVIRTTNGKTGKLLAEGSNINITLTDVKIDSTAFEDKTRLMFSKAVDIRAGNIKWTSDNKLYNFNIGNIALNSANNTLTMGRFDMKPVLNENAYVNAFPFQEDRFDLSLSGISFSGMDIKKAFDENLQAAGMNVASLSFKIYRDLAKPRDKKNRVGKYPQQALTKIPFLFSVKKITLNDSYIEYKERSNITRQAALVRFHHLHGVLSNVTNDKKAAGQEMTLVTNARFQDQTNFSSQWRFYLFHPKGRVDISGKLGPLQAPVINELVQASGMAAIREGQVDGLDFTLHGDDDNMNGIIQFLYKDLKVDLQEIDEGETKRDRKFLSSLLANIVIKNSNPKKNEAVRTASVSVTRDPNRSLFWLCWKTIFKGIMETAGVKQ